MKDAASSMAASSSSSSSSSSFVDSYHPPSSSSVSNLPPSIPSSSSLPPAPPPSSPPLFSCCLSLNPLLSLPSPDPPSPPSPLPPQVSLQTSLSHLARPLHRTHIAELLAFRRRSKNAAPPPPQRPRSQSSRHRHSLGGDKTKNLQPQHACGKNDDDTSEGRKSWELLRSGEVSNLIKQGFMERTHRRLSPGRVSPLLQEGIAEKSMSPLRGISFRKAAAHASDAVDTSASSPTSSDHQKLSNFSNNTLFTMMCRDAETKPSSNKPRKVIEVSSEAPRCLESSLHMPRSRSSKNDVDSKCLLFNNPENSDVKLTLKSKDGREVCLHLHRSILSERSEFFAARLSELWCKQKQQGAPYLMELRDCEDLESYQETLYLLYCQDLSSRLIKHSVSRVLSILKVATLFLFEDCITACLEYLEAAPWAEDEEDKIRTLLGRLQLRTVTVGDVLKRLNVEGSNRSEETLVHLLDMVIKGKDNKARREMKALVSKMLRENAAESRECMDLSKQSLYDACTACLDALFGLFTQASKVDFKNQNNDDRGAITLQIAHQADNLQWLLEILIDRHIASDFVKIWAHQVKLASMHKQIATMMRFEVSRLTARLFVAIGKGQVLCPVDVRHTLLQTWLTPLIDDFGWMQRCCKSLDKNVIEDGISQTILTLPLKHQQNILLAWFDRFSNNGDDCPNLQRAFEVWWRRTFVRPCLDG